MYKTAYTAQLTSTRTSKINMLSAARKLLQRVPRTHPLLRLASTSADAPGHPLSNDQTDHELLSLQDNLKQSGDKQVAKQQLQSLLSDGKATATHCKWALEHVSTGVKFDNGLLSAMQEKNIPIDKQAWAIVNANERREEQRNSSEMERLKYHLAKNGKDRARRYFKTMQTRKIAIAFHYGWAMTNLCQSSDEQRALMKSMKQDGVSPEVSNFNTLINIFLQEGDIDAAQHIIDVEMPRVALEPNDITKNTMAQADELASIGRTNRLKNIFEREGKDAARQVFEEMQKSSNANKIQYGWAMKHLCETSGESRALMDTMIHNGTLPDVANFNQLITKLLHDEDIDAAQHIYHVSMPAAGIEPDDITMKAMARAESLARVG